MNVEFEKTIRELVRNRASDKVVEAIKGQYEFKCPAFVFAGPGHQSKHTCEQRHPHPIDDEHSDYMYEWEGTAVQETITKKSGCRVETTSKLVFNPRHHGGHCC